MIAAEHITTLVGKNIELVCFAQYSVYIHLQQNILITVEAGLEHVHNGKRYVVQFGSPAVESNLLTILESTVRFAAVEQNGDLQLILSNGDTLRIFKERGYESYRLKIGDQELIA